MGRQRTKRGHWVALVVATAAIFVGCGGDDDGNGTSDTAPGPGDGAPSAEAGETLFAGTCASCHGQDATGIEGLGKDLTTSEWVADQTDEQLVEFIKVGRPASDPLNTTGVDMPPKGGNPALTDADIESIVLYLRSIHEG